MPFSSASVSSMPESFMASATISSVIFFAPASCIRAQMMPGASVVPRPMLAKWVMNRRLVSFTSGMPRSSRELEDTNIAMSPLVELLGAVVLVAQAAATGTPTGHALFNGTPPAPGMLSTSADPACVRLVGPTVRGQDFLVDGRGGLQNVFVYIKSGVAPSAS